MYNNLLKPLSLLFLSLFLVTACGEPGGDPNPSNPGGPQSPKGKDGDKQGPGATKTPTLDKIQQLHTDLQDAALKGKFKSLWEAVSKKFKYTYGPFEASKISAENQAVLDVLDKLSPAIDQ